VDAASQNHWDRRIEHVAISDVGLRRANNQDNFAVALAPSADAWAARGHLFIVADGMGAHAAGELASKLSVDNIPHTYWKLAGQPPPTALVQALIEANKQINGRGRANRDFEGMGTTTTALLLVQQGALVAHVGDSRCYRLRRRDCVLEQLSFDHSLVWELRARGKFGPEHEFPGVPKNVITRSLGPTPDVEIDLEGPFPTEPGDVFLLCSDGLSGQVEDDEIGAILATMEPNEAVRSLVDLANLRGGPDNITVIVVKIREPLVGPQSRQPLPPVRLDAVATRPKKPLGPEIAIAPAVGLVLSIGLLAFHWVVAMIALLVTLGVSGYLFRDLLFGATQPGGRVLPGGRYGRGPHREVRSLPDDRFLDRLSGLLDELREAAGNEDWAVDWYEFNRHYDAAVQARENKKPAEATREFCRAMSFMMSELRAQRRKAPS
jgi:protein phosphatase